MAKSRKATKAKAGRTRKSPGAAKARRSRSADKPSPPAAVADLLSMHEAIALLKTTRATFYRWLRAGKVRGVKLGRQWRFDRREIDRLLKGEQPRIELRADITPLIDRLAERLSALGVVCRQGPAEAAVEHAVRMMALVGWTLRASDIHIEPFEDAAHLRYRVDGVLGDEIVFDRRLLAAVAERWKTMAGCNVQETVLPQDGRIGLVRLTDVAGARVPLKTTTKPPDLAGLEAQIEQLLLDKDEAVKSADYERAAELREKIEQLRAKREEMRRLLKEKTAAAEGLAREADAMVCVDPDTKAQQKLDIRVSFLPAQLGEAVTARLLRPEAVKLGLDALGYAPANRARLEEALAQPNGMIVVTGPTGCGKTTTLYSCLEHLISPAIKIMSVEDPVEYLIRGITQVPLREKEGVTFPRAIRAMLRSDPDVIMVGEIRNQEILMLCCQVAMTGHLVLTTLHTDDAAAALKRMLDIRLPAFMVADTVRLVSAQRLVRRLCGQCSRPTEPKRLEWARQAAGEGGLDWDGLEQGFREPVGCKACGGSGYSGRMLISEMLTMSPAIARALSHDAPTDELRSIAVSEGMATMAADGIRSAAAGLTTVDEIHRVLAVAMAMR